MYSTLQWYCIVSKIIERAVTGQQVARVWVWPVYQLWRVSSGQRPFLWMVFTGTKVCFHCQKSLVSVVHSVNLWCIVTALHIVMLCNICIWRRMESVC